MVFLKYFFKKVDFEKKADDKKAWKFSKEAKSYVNAYSPESSSLIKSIFYYFTSYEQSCVWIYF